MAVPKPMLTEFDIHCILESSVRRRNVNRSTQRLGLLAHNYGNPQIFSFLFIFFHRARMGKLNAKRPLAPRNVGAWQDFFIKH